MTALRRTVVWMLAALAAPGFSACSSFEREWRTAQRAEICRDPFAGAWEGRWTSATHGSPGKPMGGRLRCVLTPASVVTNCSHGRRIVPKSSCYSAHFRANWLAFAGNYRVLFTTQRRGQGLRFEGAHDLGPLAGGVYRYAGQATPDRFVSSYDSKHDRGTFEMTRPAP